MSKILAIIDIPDDMNVDEFVAVAEQELDYGIRLVETKTIPDNTIMSDVVVETEDDFICAKIWRKEDIVSVLEEEGFLGNDKNIDVIRYQTTKALTACDDADWNCIREAISDNEENLEVSLLKNLIYEGLKNETVKLISSCGVKCQIGEYEFYFLKGKLSECNLDSYLSKNTTEEITEHIFEVLKSRQYAQINGISEDEYEDIVSMLGGDSYE